MKKNFPLISVIVPTHNNEATISVALDSLIAQSYPNLEIIVIDDNSTDGTGRVAENYTRRFVRVSYYSLPYDDPKRMNAKGRNVNAGYLARNYGLEKTRGEWITFQDADDASLSNRIEAQYLIAKRYGALHVCLEWQRLDESLLGKSFDFERALENEPDIIIRSETIIESARRARGIAMTALGTFRALVPFGIKTARVINRLFFGTLESYPGSGNSPLFARSIAGRIKFRSIDDRIWPSFTGRGADRDFNFQAAVRDRKSVV